MFPCFLQDNNWLISFFIIYSAKNSLYFMTNFHASCFNQTFRKIKINRFWFCYFVGLFFVIITSIVITTRLNSCKVFWWFYHPDKKDRVIVSFHFFGLWNLFGGLATNLIFKSLNCFTYRHFSFINQTYRDTDHGMSFITFSMSKNNIKMKQKQ